MKLFELIRSANHNLFRNKIRTFLTILAIFIGSFTIILNAAINAGVNAFIDDQTASLGGEDVLLIMSEGALSAMSSMSEMSGEVQEYNPNATLSTMNEKDIEKIKAIDGIDPDSVYAQKNIQTAYITSEKTTKKYSLNMVAGMPVGEYDIPMSAGAFPSVDSKEDEIVLEEKYVKPLGFKDAEESIGQVITIGAKNPLATLNNPSAPEYLEFKAKIVGIEAPSIVTTGDNMVSHPLEDKMYEALNSYLPADMRDRIMYLQARYDTSRFTEQEIKDKMKEAGYLSLTISDMMGMIRSFFDAIMIVFTIFGGIALLAAAIGIVNTLLMSVEERTREIGLDKALGMSSGKVFASFSIEAMLLGFWGSFFGVGIAMVIGTVANTAVHAPGAFLEVFPTFELFKFTFANVLPVVITVMLLALIAGTAPAAKAAHKDPIEALRYE